MLHTTKIRWGESQTQEETYNLDYPYDEYCFDTEAELNAFLDGVEAAMGYLSWTQVDDLEIPTRDEWQALMDANRLSDLYFLQGAEDKHGFNIIFIPQGWCDEFSLKAGAEYGPDAPFSDEGRPEIYGYGPTLVHANSECDTMWWPVATLAKLACVTESVARDVHPALFEHLDKINKE